MKVGLAVGCLLLAVACAHSTQTGGNPDVKDATAPQSAESSVRARKVTPKTPVGHPPLAASPSELMQPGSQERIARALKGKGVVARDDVRGEQLTAGVRKFQESQGLAATGFPDHETLLRLGIDPKKVDKSLENFSGTRPGEAQADVSKRSDDAWKGGSGEQGSANERDARQPPSDSE
jgi:peptidoglycan hydrolase-like protein with peptidoglycan-binding domain